MKKILAVALVCAMLMQTHTMAATTNSSGNLPDSSPSASAVSWMVENDLLQGDKNGNMNPNAMLSRAQMAAIISRMYGAEKTTSLSAFSDVSTDAWYYASMAKCVQMGIFQGDSAGMLNPQSPISREAAFVVMARAYCLEPVIGAELNAISGIVPVSNWAKPYVAAMVKAGYIQGSGELNAKAPILRQEFAQTVRNMAGMYVTKENADNGVINGNAIVREPGLSLNGLTIKGDLILADGMDAASIALSGVIIEGRLIIRGGSQSVALKNSTISNGTVINDVNEAVKLTAENTGLGKLTVSSDLVLNGNASELIVTAADTKVTIVGGTIGQMTILPDAAGTDVQVNSGAKVTDVAINAKNVTVEGKGSVKDIAANAGNAIIGVVGAKVTAADGVTGVKAGNKDVLPKESTVVGVPAVSGGGSSGSSGGSSGGGGDGGGPQKTYYTVTFNANGGSGAMSAGTASAGTAFTLPENGFTPPAGQQFKAWAIGSVSGTQAGANSAYTFTDNATVYAIWEDIPTVSYAVTYDANGGSGAMSAGTASAGTAFTLPENGFTPPAGQQFKAWAIGSVSGTQAGANSAYTFTDNATVYAIWEDIPTVSYAVTYDANGGSGAKEAATVADGQSLTLPAADAFTAPEGKEFQEWRVQVGDSQPVSKAPGEQVTITADTAVIAVWKDKEPEAPATFTGHAPINPVEAAYTNNNLNGYGLPKKVTLTLSDGRTVEVAIITWQSDEVMAAGKTVTLKATLDDLPSAAKYDQTIDKDSLEAITVTMQLKLKEAVPTPDITITWNKTDKKYVFNENPIVTVANYTGDGSDIKLTTSWPDYLNLTDGDGLTYNASDKTVTIDSAKIMANGFKTPISGYLYFGTKSFSVYITYTTDRSVKFNGMSSAGNASYTEVSRKKDFTTTAAFTNVPQAEIEAATITFSDKTAAQGVALTATAAENVYTLTVPYAKVAEKIAAQYGSDKLALTMNIQGVAPVTVTLTYMAAPALSLDSSKGYYAAQNPVITLENFSFDQTEMDALAVSIEDDDGARALTKDTNYTVDTANKKITLISESVLGASTLSAEKTITVTVSADEDDESSSVDVKYKKDRALQVVNVTDATPGATVSAQLGGSEDGYEGLELYFQDHKIDGTSVGSEGDYASGYTYYVKIPYKSIASSLQNSAVTLTAKLAGSPDATFTVTFGEVDPNGPVLPIDLHKTMEQSDNNQEGLPLLYAGSYSGPSIKIYATDGSSFDSANWAGVVVTIKVKGASDDTAALGTVGYYSSYSNYFDLSFSSDSVESGAIAKGQDGKWPIYTITFSKVGYQIATLDVALRNSWTD